MTFYDLEQNKIGLALTYYSENAELKEYELDLFIIVVIAFVSLFVFTIVLWFACRKCQKNRVAAERRYYERINKQDP